MTKTIFCFAPWQIVENEPRHNTWHFALYAESKALSKKLHYFGYKPPKTEPWINPVFNRSIFYKYPFISLRNFRKLIREIGSRTSHNEENIFYIFEGNFFWLFLFLTISPWIGNAFFICNLFSSESYNRKIFLSKNSWYRLLFTSVLRMLPENLVVTFDTKTMAKKVNGAGIYNARVFPVPGSFSQEIQISVKSHLRALVSLRDFSYEDLSKMFFYSCKHCEFTVLPRGPQDKLIYEKLFREFSNVNLDKNDIKVEDYGSYIKSFDYSVLLYKPSADASGRLLDAILKGVAVCIPKESEEWCEIAEDWGYSYEFEWDLVTKNEKIFNHPEFNAPKRSGEIPFSPKNSLIQLENFFTERFSDSSHSRKAGRIVISTFAIFIWSIVAAFLNVRLFERVKSHLR